MHQISYFVLCPLLVQLVGGEYGDRIKNATITWGENLLMEESRHTYAVAPYPVADPHTELPITFQAPYINARDYWNDPARRTGFDYNPYTLTKPITDGIQNFYEMMHQFFGVEDQPRRAPPPSPYRQPPLDFPQQRPYYIPQPKPIRAQIQKLEPPRSQFPFYQGSPHPENFPHFVKILNEVVEQNVYKRPEQVLEKPDYIYDYIVPTTYKPPNRFKYRPSTGHPLPVSIQDKLPPVKQGENTVIPYVTEPTTYRSPSASPGNRVVFPPQTEAVPQLDYAIDVRNVPRAAERPTTQPPSIIRSTIASSPLPLANIDNSPEIETQTTGIDVTTDGETGVQSVGTTPFPVTATSNVDIFGKLQEALSIEESTTSPDTTQPSTTLSNLLSTAVTKEPPSTIPPEATTILPARLLQEVTTEDVPATTSGLETTTEISSQSSDIHTVTELLYTMEPLERRRFQGPIPKRYRTVATTDSTTSADYVTDLTVQGLTDATAVHASVPRYLHTPNVTSVIGYVLSELNATAPPVNFDELSLDAKILKDTNWDGFQQSTVPTTNAGETTTDVPHTEVPTTATEVDDVPTTPVPTTLPPVTTELPATSTQPPSLPLQKQMIVATRMTQSVSRGGVNMADFPSPRNAPDEENEIRLEATATTSSTTESSEITPRPRKYRRRQRVHSFTPKPKNETSTETPLRFSASRPFQPSRRSRPNATLTFSSRFNRRNDETTEVRPQRTEEETKKIRNLYRRRNYPSPLRRLSSTTEAPDVEEDASR